MKQILVTLVALSLAYSVPSAAQQNAAAAPATPTAAEQEILDLS